ncbi:hypothetical protein K402DRAFT_397563 [Aulographum hederae CBS 113979]|uniref:Uncharacterized protein n=1 Tax=Aulographum hederae CBS 113979 TaxID=1176131 RepID=A0A6G1GNS8_9PEZI|nr:hypothetical protein K402DRAFT_397563 [Aulographum hederae CBS 113979]
MTALVTRSPLGPLDMSHLQRATRGKSARRAFEDDDDALPPAKRAKTDANGAAAAANKTVIGKSSGANPKKAKASYDEDDGGFKFTRTRSKKAKAAPQPEPIAAEKSDEKELVPRKSSRKRMSFSEPTENATAPVPKQRRSLRLSGESVEVDPKGQITSVSEKPRRGKKATAKPSPKQPDQPKDVHDSMDLLDKDDRSLQVEKQRKPTKIALPFADTPVIRRNKEMRKNSGQGGHRRSSTGMRGRRASSLIDSGSSNAAPHAEVNTKEFYKLIEQSVPEPRRMKQLLIWCGTRALPEKAVASGDTNAVLAADAARHIQEELLKDFANKSEMSDWFNREDITPAVLVKKPNPRNAQNAAKLKELEQEIERLQEEKRSWESLLSSSTAKAATSVPTKPPSDSLPDAPSTSTERYPTSSLQHQQQASSSPSNLYIDPALLDDPSQTAILNSLLIQDTSSSPSTLLAISTDALSKRLQTLSAGLEPTIDLFADGVHKLGQFRGAADAVAERILKDSAEALERRDKEARDKSGGNVGISDVLGALGRVAAEER